ncbi:MAG TPA: GTP cyclohydrolase FolE2 [Zeimonas sp.]
MNFRDSDAMLGLELVDVQGGADQRQLPIQRVGVRDIRYPLRWRSAGGEQPSVGEFGLYVALPADRKGTHMSRFVALLERRLAPAEPALDVERTIAMHAQMLQLLDADSGRIELSFPLFVRKTAPVSQVTSLMDYRISLTVDGSATAARATLVVQVPVTSLCPCSKEIADYGAHNQRSHVTVSVQSSMPIEPEEIIALAEAHASSELYGLLKRVDEKHVTERAYENPKFVEDLVRDVAGALRGDERIERWFVEVENFESIHNHSAFARIEG